MDPKFIEIAKNELREDETRKVQALEQVRERLAKHPFLSNLRNDDSFLLRFLRVRKFNVDEAMVLAERTGLSLNRFPQYYDNIDKSMEIFELGYCYPLIDRDAEGRRVIFIQTGKNDPDKYSVSDSLKLLIHVVMILLEEEETQIAGFVFIYDNTNISAKHILTPVEARDLTTIIKNCSPTRQKATYMMNLPTYANIMIEVVKPFLSEKMRQRFHVLKDSEELKKKIDPKILPAHLGGVHTETEMMDNFRKIRAKYYDIYKSIFDLKIEMEKVDWEKVWPNKDFEVVGSFRKLDID